MDQSVIGLFKKDEWVPIVSSRTKDSGFSTELSRNVRQWEAGDTAVEEKTGDLNRDNKESIQIEQLLIGMLTEMKTEMTEIKKELADMKSRLDDQQAGSGGGDGGDGGDSSSCLAAVERAGQKYGRRRCERRCEWRCEWRCERLSGVLFFATPSLVA